MHVRKLIVMEDEQLYGVLSQTDIFVAIKQKLQDEERKNRNLLEISKSNIFTLSLDGTITYVNPSFMELLGVTDSSKLIGKSFLPKQFWAKPNERFSFLSGLQNEAIQVKELNLKTTALVWKTERWLNPRVLSWNPLTWI